MPRWSADTPDGLSARERTRRERREAIPEAPSRWRALREQSRLVSVSDVEAIAANTARETPLSKREAKRRARRVGPAAQEARPVGGGRMS